MTLLPRFQLRLATVLIFLLGIAISASGQFETRATTKMPQGAFSIASGDFNNDGFADIVVMDDSGFTVSLGKGDGTFLKPTFFKNQLSYSLAVGDFNNDGNQDIVVANLDPSTVQVYLGKGDGTFRPPISSNTTEGSYFVVVGDFNNDKKADLALIDPPYISVLLGNGDGTFQPPNDNNSFTGPLWLAVGDFNNDHHLDVLVTGSFGASYQVGVLLGKGDGTLQDSINTPLEYVPATITAGDLNGDGKVDAVVGYDLAGIAVFLGNGDGTFQPAANYNTTGLDGGWVIISDLNRDGKQDLAVPSGPPALDIFWGNGDGTFQAAQGFASPIGGLPTVCDLNGDKLPDVVMANPEYGTGTMLNTGVVAFSPTTPLDFTAPGQQMLRLTNDATKPLSIRAITVSGSAFKIRNGCGTSLRGGASCNVSVIFKPVHAGTYNGLITLKDSASSKPQFIELSGTEN